MGDWTKRFKKIADDAFLINASSAIIDGEIVVPAADSTADFSVLRNELKGKSTKIAMVAFDLLYITGYDLRKLPLIERKALLKKLIAKLQSSSVKASKSTGRRYLSMLVRSASKASSQKFATAAIFPPGAMTG
jgi:bifunctional non-homologous end joining protein LigD